MEMNGLSSQFLDTSIIFGVCDWKGFKTMTSENSCHSCPIIELVRPIGYNKAAVIHPLLFIDQYPDQ